jgi:hypothetical protein
MNPRKSFLKKAGRAAGPLIAAVALLAAAFLFGSGRSTIAVGIERTPESHFRLTQTVEAVSTQNAVLAEQLAVLEQTARPPGPTPTGTPEPPPPSFSSLRFATQPEALQPRSYFVAGIPRIFASWDYAGMRDGMLVRRVWRHQGEIYQDREELWDASVYGTEGVMRGISIFDDESGLPPGEYSLTLYIDGIVQDILPETGLQTSARFWLFPPDLSGPVLSPDQARTAEVHEGGRLFIEEPDGLQHVVAVGQEISSLAWFPDSRRLLYAERDRSGQLSPDDDRGVTHRLWLVDVETGERSLMAASGENFHSPLVSPNGAYVAALAGPYHRSGCQISPALAVLALDLEHRRQAIYLMQDFELLDEPWPISEAYPDREAGLMHWEGEALLTVYLSWPCPPRGVNPDGPYRLDLISLTAIKIE